MSEKYPARGVKFLNGHSGQPPSRESAGRRVKDHQNLPNYMPLLKEARVRQVVLHESFPPPGHGRDKRGFHGRTTSLVHVAVVRFLSAQMLPRFAMRCHILPYAQSTY